MEILGPEPTFCARTAEEIQPPFASGKASTIASIGHSRR
jgi:hypothetical protein